MARQLAPQLRGLNLNLFVVFDALLRAGSVTAAAAELGVTQSAVSHSLRELRVLLDDPVLVRTGRGMEPTSRARELAPAVRASLESLGNALSAAPSFDPQTSTRTFTVATADEISVTMLPRLIASVQEHAPGVVVDVRGRHRAELSRLDRGELDVVLGLDPGSASFDAAPLYSDTFSCLVRVDHPSVGSRLTLKRYTSLRHILVGPLNTGRGIVDDALAKTGRRRHVAVHTAYFLSAPELVACTDYVLTLPTHLARIAAARLPVRMVKAPLQLPSFTVYRVWSKLRGAEPGLAWFNKQLAHAATALR